MSQRPTTILLVEDNMADVDLTKYAFEKSSFDYDINITFDGEEALRYLYQQEEFINAAKPDLILLDLNLPKMDGHDVLQIIKNDKALCHIPVIILSSSQLTKDILDSYQYRASSYITKPHDFDKFVKIIESIETVYLAMASLPMNDPAR